VVRSPHGDEPSFLGTAWSLVQLRAVVLSAVAVGLAWVLPPWYDLPALHYVLLALSVRPVIMSLQNPTLFILYRRLDYRTPFLLDTAQAIIAIPATILLAWYFRNVWGLVLGLLFGDVVRLILSHFLCPKAPRLQWHRPAIHELSHFGASIFFNTMVYGAWIYFDRLAGPKLLPPEKVGLYVLAWSLAESLDVLIARGCDVFFSMLSRVPEGPARFQLFRRTARRIAVYLLPGFVVAALCAPWAFKLIYAETFYGAAVLFGLLTARLILRAVSQLQFMYLMMRGEVFVATRAYIVSFLIVAGTFVVWVQVLDLGVLGVAISSLVGITTFTLGQTAQMVRRGEVSPWPAAIGLFWTAVAVAGVLFLYV
jgi:O-antigen/teichoic acid export membrane protein